MHELADEFGASVEVTSNNHLRLRLPNGRSYFTAGSSSDRRAVKNLRSGLRNLSAER